MPGYSYVVCTRVDTTAPSSSQHRGSRVPAEAHTVRWVEFTFLRIAVVLTPVFRATLLEPVVVDLKMIARVPWNYLMCPAQFAGEVRAHVRTCNAGGRRVPDATIALGCILPDAPKAILASEENNSARRV